MSQRKCSWEKFRNSSICITGATGLIGSHFVKRIIELNKSDDLNCSLLLLVRSVKKAQKIFSDHDELRLISWDMEKDIPEIDYKIDYFVHAASPTSSKGFTDCPVEVIEAIYNSAKNVLLFSMSHRVKKVVLLSTMEVYGEISHKVSENEFGSLDPMVVRNCYPESKRLAECLFASYANEYNVSACVLRLAQTFGSGVSRGDERVFAEFARNAISGENIILYSDGSTKNPYLSLDDAINAIAFILLYGEAGEAYNAANNETYCSISEMAESVLEMHGVEGARVIYQTDTERSKAFRKASNLDLDTRKLEALGWTPHDGLEEMYSSMISSWKSSN